MPEFLSDEEFQTRLRMIGLLRLNITDTAVEPADQLFTDDQLELWLDAFNGSINRATHRALITMATSEVLVSKKIRTQDLSTDGPAVADSLMRLAATYKTQADEEDAGSGSWFDVVGFAPYGHLEGAEYRL